MKRLTVLMVVATLAVSTAGCQQCSSWFKKPSGPTCSSPIAPAAPCMVPGAAPPAMSPAPGGPGCNSCSSNNTLPVLSAPQGYAAAPTN